MGVGAQLTVSPRTSGSPSGKRMPASPDRIAVRPSARPPIFTDVTDRIALPFVHHENAFVDFDRDPLIPQLLSTEGPFMAVADVNGDGLDDVFIGGAKDQPGQLLIQQRDGTFIVRRRNGRSSAIGCRRTWASCSSMRTATATPTSMW